MKLKLNMKNVGSMWTPVPDDVYRVRITSIEDLEGNAGPYCKVNMLICEGEFAETRGLSSNWSFSEKALWKTQKALEAFSGMEWNEDDMDFDSNNFMNMEAYVLTVQETYEKKDGSGEAVKSAVAEYYSLSEMADTSSL